MWRSWWPFSNSGFVNGPESGVWTVDVDVKDGARGNETMRDLERRHGRFSRTWTQLTPTGGRHIVYRWPLGMTTMRRRLGPGVEIQGAGRITVLAPSRYPDPRYEHPYGTHRPLSELAAAPAWLVELVRADEQPPREQLVIRDPLPAGTLTLDGRRRLLGVLRVVLEAEPGSRHDAILWAAGRAAEMVLEGQVAADVALGAVAEAARRAAGAKYDDREIDRVIADGWRYTVGRNS